MRLRRKLLIVVLSLFACCRADTQSRAQTTWTDGIFPYPWIKPIAGYYVPRDIFAKGYNIPLDQVLARSRAMPAAELSDYLDETGSNSTIDFPLFVLPHRTMTVFRWRGGLLGDAQDVIPRVWKAPWWDTFGQGELRVDPMEQIHYAPIGDDRLYVMLEYRHPRNGPLHTQQVVFGEFPGLEPILRHGLKLADTAVCFSLRTDQPKEELLDCVKGEITRPELEKCWTRFRDTYDSMVFLRKTAEGQKVWFSCGTQGLHAEGVELRLDGSLSKIEVDALQDKNAFRQSQLFRWRLAREALPKDQAAATCTLRCLNPHEPFGEWMILELTAGKDGPVELFRASALRGGGPVTWLVHFRFLRGEEEVELQPDRTGMFNAENLQWDQYDPKLDVEYRFLHCATGVMKMAIRPRHPGWSAVVQGVYDVWRPRKPEDFHPLRVDHFVSPPITLKPANRP